VASAAHGGDGRYSDTFATAAQDYGSLINVNQNRLPRSIRRRAVAELPFAACMVARLGTYFVPHRADARVSGWVAHTLCWARPSLIDSLARRMARNLSEVESDRYRKAAEEFIYSQVEWVWGLGRGMRKNGWHPTTELIGVEHLEEALTLRSGAILWRLSLGNAIAVNQALSRAGHAPVHLTREDHLVPGQGWWSLRVAAPLLQRGEARSVAERVVIPVHSGKGYLTTLRERLAENRVITIVGDSPGTKALRSVSVPFLGAERSFPTGAPSLAYRTGAALFPVYALRTGPMTYRVHIAKQIVVDDNIDIRAFEDRAVETYADLLEELLSSHPQSWRGWRDSD
jgi:lauroyl/myristoyl acyltransferase